MAGDWPLVGRTEELGRLEALLADPRNPSVVLAGTAGVGKTRLALECLRRAESMGLVPARVTATRGASHLPLGALAPLLPADDHEAGAVDDRGDLLRRCAAALLHRAGGRRLVLFIDDAHLLDDTSATLVQQLAGSRAATVLCTVRTGEPAPDAVVSLWKDNLAERFEVGRLNAAAIEGVLSAALGGEIDAAAVALLAVHCQGNVLFLRELVLGALDDDSLQNDGGMWRLVAPLHPSGRLIELVETRLAGLRPEERALLEVVSFGEPLGPAELAALADPGLAEGLERAGLLSTHRDGQRLQVRPAHPVYGEVLRARMPGLRIPIIARALAEVVEHTGGRRREDVLRVATWRLEGGGARADVMLAAATTARWRYDFPLAERLARAALDAGAGFDAALLAAQLAGLRGRSTEAQGELARLAESAADDARRGLVAVTRIDNTAFYLGDPHEALHIAEKAEAEISDPAWRDEVTVKRATLLLGLNGPGPAVDAVEPLLRTAGGRALVWACMVGATAMTRCGRIEAGLAAAERGRALYPSLTRPLEWYPWILEFHRADALAAGGRLAEAEALATEQYRQALAIRSTEAQAWFGWLLAKTVGDRGNVDAARRHAREAATLFRELGRPQFELFSLIYLTLAEALGGFAEPAERTLAAIDGLNLAPTYYMGVDLHIARAWTALAAGSLPKAHRLFDEAAALGEEIGDRLGTTVALHALARTGAPRKSAERLAEAAGAVDGPLAAARAAHSWALARREGSALEQASTDFDALGAHLLAAEASNDAAMAYQRAGKRRAASAAQQRARALARRCPGAMTPALTAGEYESGLTKAELRVARLGAAGRSNREIAEDLFLSVRTVETHLQNIYQKLGISGRAELEAALASGD